MNFENTLDKYGGIIEQELKNFFKSVVEEAYTYHPFVGDLYKVLEEFVLRKGKRLASCSTLMAYKGYNEIDEKIIRVCCGIEIYRHCILIHDDLVDLDEMRRGDRTVHKLFEDEHDERFGFGCAVFAGNIAYSLALQAIASSGFRDKLSEVYRLLFSGYKDVNESQILDLLFEYTNPNVDEWKVMASKRAASLFETTILTGAMLGNAPKNDITFLKNAANYIGYAFDIQDDLIDTFASEEQYGRKPGGDLLRGKKPLHIILTSERENSLPEKMKSFEIDEIRELIKRCGALEEVKKVSKAYANSAREEIMKTSMSKEAKNFFTSFIDYIVESLDWYK